ncbi:aldehyde dehydrogenase family protein [Brevibacterium sp. 50QC2O2]|uniref:L-piperidine-6-carboxylate dehydrogenase n=1 Tax=unclassified Brevibacterium TaxID=2614124 RepID=UPI00211C123F|nr:MULTISPECIES: aldehyde dehydrogenase family protein [unclassified Brevibacterium]MCQ9368782.1 aldehyde dehydrogenase family protein [Brevibacterium sp. 91QC2O2]MCQ9388573.1 aldehyde dehydrogenase family protein [Brevibacterium sp. 50QC2O2]
MTSSLPTREDVLALAQAGLTGCGLDFEALLGADSGTAAGASASADSGTAPTIPARSPLTGDVLGRLAADTPDTASAKLDRARAAFETWRDVPAPVRGKVVQRWGELLREHKVDLGKLVTVEAGKTPSEAEGEVQEMIDICELALGQSRQLFGKTLASERPGHRLMETWHPLGVVGIISAFNFPVAPYAWNTALAIVCGDPVVWKPSEVATLSAVAATALLTRAAAELGAPADLAQVLVGDRTVGQVLVDDARVDLVSATGSVRMGREIGPAVARRFGQSLLELGGNNAAIVAPSADQDLAIRGSVFAAAGTAGQRCTTLRRLIVHSSIAEDFTAALVAAYDTLAIGSPTTPGVLVGPLISKPAYEAMQAALAAAVEQGGQVLTGGERVLVEQAPDAYYVKPAVVKMPAQTQIVTEETFAPILYVMEYEDFDAAIAMNNAVPQGLSSAVFTTELKEAERFIARSDAGIANVNIGTSGAEIGGAFGGNKETGWGRESGTDSWHAYMRQATNTVNYSDELPLAQGVEFL